MLPPAFVRLIVSVMDESGTGAKGPLRREFWRSPLRGPWFTAVLSMVLLVGSVVLVVTGLLSYAAYNPWLGAPNDLTPNKGFLGFYLFPWPTEPSWLYWLTQSLHVLVGLIMVPVVLAKLWSVLPKLFEWPPAASPAQAVERLSVFLLVGSTIFELVTGVMNIQYYYLWGFGFYTAHLYGAWVFLASLVLHTAVRARRTVAGLRGRRLRTELRTSAAATRAEPPDPDRLVSPNPAPATISRRGAFALIGASSGTILLLSVGQVFGGTGHALAWLAPRGRSRGSGPNDFQINKTAEYHQAVEPATDPSWRLRLEGGPRPVTFSRADLLAMPQTTAELVIMCVEGWSTGVQTWTGVRLDHLARRAGVPRAHRMLAQSIQRFGGFGSAEFAANQIHDPQSLLALRVNGADLSLDHGYPARIIVPAAPGVHDTKWVGTLRFSAGGR